MELFAGVMQTWRPVCALVLRKIFFPAAATGALIRNSSRVIAMASLTIETSWSSVKPENRRLRLKLLKKELFASRRLGRAKARPYNCSIQLLPTVHGAVELAIDGQVRAAIGIVGGELLVNIDAEAGSITGVHHSVGTGVGVWKDAISLIGVTHVFLNAEIVTGIIKTQSACHADGAEVGVA